MNSGSAAAADNYRKFLALRPDAARDTLAGDARKRLQGLPAAATPPGR
jgi:hypothetical protein